MSIVKRGEPFAILIPPPSANKKKKCKMPDFAARRKAIWGDRVFSAAEVAAMRADELEGEEG